LLLLVAGVAPLLIAPGRGDADAGPGPSIRLNPPGERKAAFEVVGLDPADTVVLARGEFRPEDWAALFAVSTVPAESQATRDHPPLIGSYRVEPGVVRFVPRFPLEPGVVYRALFDPTRLPSARGATGTRGAMTAEFTLPKRVAAPTTGVTAVYPTRDIVPENLLKLYLQFSAPMGRGDAYGHVHLRDASGKDLDLPFLELGEELWDPRGMRLTLLFDPGRIKRGLKPREELGPVLREGGTYTLVIDRSWPDAQGQPLVSEVRRTFRVGPPDETPPDPSTWSIHTPVAGTRDPLVLTSPEPLDRALFGRLPTVQEARGSELPGEAAIDAEETRWRFTPDRPWTAGEYSLSVNKDLEDLAGNSIGRLFEVDVFDKIEKQTTAQTVVLPFRIGPVR